MKRILITGANSYVGTNVEKWLQQTPEKYDVETLDMKNPSWKQFDFSKFDVVFHVAGIAHVSTSKKMKDLYFSVNKDLAIETARIAKTSGVKQFIFMSSMIVYDSRNTKITSDTIPNPDNYYGLSKLKAEEGIIQLLSDNFKVTILRAPMIYGPKSKGNFPKILDFVRQGLIFPDFFNQRSMIFIYNLCNVIKYLIDVQGSGIYFPQNKEYSCSSYIVKYYSHLFGKKIWFTKLFNPLIRILKQGTSVFNKLFGNYYYEVEMSKNVINYSIYSLDNSLMMTQE